MSLAKGTGGRRCLIKVAAAVLTPLVVIGIIIAIMLPKAPDANATDIIIKNIKLNGFESLTVELDISLDIKNTNKNIGIGFDTVNVTYAFPANPDQLVGHGSMEGGEVKPGGVVARPLSSTFEAPLSVLGANAIRDINRGSSDIIVRGNIRGYSTVLRSKFRLSSDLECIVTYWWDSQTTTRSCKTDKRIRLAYSS